MISPRERFLQNPPDAPLEHMVYFVNELPKLSHYPETRRLMAL